MAGWAAQVVGLHRSLGCSGDLKVIMINDGETLANSQYLIGCPVWACAHWKRTVFAVKAAKNKWLHQSSHVS